MPHTSRTRLLFTSIFALSASLVACSSNMSPVPAPPLAGSNVFQSNAKVVADDDTPSPAPTTSPYSCGACGCQANSIARPKPIGFLSDGQRRRQGTSAVAVPSPTASVCYPSTSATPYIAAMEVAQAVQNLQSPLPLVAGRQALLRVFVVDAYNASPGPIQVTIGSAPPIQITAPPAITPFYQKQVVENNIALSYNYLIPASQVQPTTLTASLLNPSPIPSVLQVTAALVNTTTNTPYNSVMLPPTTVIPAQPLTIYGFSVFLANSLGSAANITAGFANKVLFVPSATYQNMGQIQERKYDVSGGTEDERALLTDLRAKAVALNIAPSASNVALGVYALDQDGEDAGFAALGDTGVAYSFDGNFVMGAHPENNALAEAVATHEIGHSLGLEHANTGNAGNCTSSLSLPNPPPPYPPGSSGQINHDGYDLSGAMPVELQADTVDFMGYCDPPSWVSDQDWLAMSQLNPGQAVATQSAARKSSKGSATTGTSGMLLDVSGEISPVMAMEGRTLVSNVGALELAPGADYVEGLDALGNILFTSQTFGSVSVHGSSAQMFSVDIPITAAQQQALHALVLFANGATFTVTSKAVGPPTAVATNVGGGNVEVSWNPTLYPAVIIHISNTDDAIFRDQGPVAIEEVATTNQTLNIEFSDGVKSVYAAIPVLPCPATGCMALPTNPPTAPSPIPSIVPTLSPPSPAPTVSLSPVPSPSLSPLSNPDGLPSSALGIRQNLNIVAQDYYLVNGQEDLQLASPLPVFNTDSEAKAVRINTVVALTTQASAWVELGDTAGTFGTSATTQTWFGHYFAWHNVDGSYGADTIGTEFPTGVHEFHIGPSDGNTTWEVTVDNSVSSDLDEPALTVGVATDAYMANSNVAVNTFTNGTSISGLQYLDANGYSFWDSGTPENFLYPTASTTFDASSAAVIYNNV